MRTASIPKASRNNILLTGIALAFVLLFAFIPLARPGSISSMPWKTELVAGVFLIAAFTWALAKGIVTTALLSSARWVCIWMAAFVIWSGASATWARSGGWVIHHTLVWGCYLFFLILFLRWVQEGKGLTVICFVFGVVSFVIALMMIVDLTTAVDFLSIQGTFRIRYGKFGEMLVTASPVMAAVALYARGRVKTAGFIVIWLVNSLAMMLSLSRGVLLASIAAHVILFIGAIFLSGRSFRKKALLLAGIWFVFTAGVQIGSSILTSVPSSTEYLTGAVDPTMATVTFRTFTWNVSRQMALGHWMVGVGADNFGIAFNEARAELAAKHPENTSPEVAEEFVTERAHNETLQIFCELGIVGSLLLLAAVAAFSSGIVGAFKIRGLRMSAIFWASVAGMVGFGVSSIVSSFSFRAMQNGIAFFMVFAIALNEVRKVRRKPSWLAAPSRWIAASGIAVAALMFAFAGLKAFAEYALYNAERTADAGYATVLYERALRIDPDNAPAHLAFANRLATNDDYASAARYLRDGIDRGLGTTITYAVLADHCVRAGDLDSAKQELAEAVTIYPNSVFIRVKNSKFLNEQGDSPAAEREMAAAKAVDLKQALGWQAIMKEGSVAAFYRSQQDADVAAPDDLRPKVAVYDYLDKNEMFRP